MKWWKSIDGIAFRRRRPDVEIDASKIEVTKSGNLIPKVRSQVCPHCGYYCTGKSVFCLPSMPEE